MGLLNSNLPEKPSTIMKIRLTSALLLIFIRFSVFPVSSQHNYSDFRALTLRLSSLQDKYPQICNLRSLTRTAGGRDIWLLTAGTGKLDEKPGIVVCGGIEGNHLLGQELALGFAEKLLENYAHSEVKSLLGRITFYILPNLSPDATEMFFADTRYERTVNTREYDEDRDFLTDEDPFEDLNNDGLITQIRIHDPAGSYRESSSDSKIMVMADLAKGEMGKYLLYSEGIDNDEDGSFNEDGEGGVNFNNNLTFRYEAFGKNSGPYPVSEPETKAVLDFLFDRFNVFAVFSFGPQDNLGQPMKSAESGESDKIRKQDADDERQYRRRPTPTTSILRSDEIINKMVSEKYHEITGAKGAPAVLPARGNFMDWAYYHYGRYSFSTPGWWFPVEKTETREEAFMKYAVKNKINDVFVPWTEVKLPGFEGKKVEVGGIKPFVMINPPADTLFDLVGAHYKFLLAVSSMHPELEFLDVKTENVGENVYRLSLKVHNKGLFATCTEMGDNNLWTRIMRIVVTPAKNQTIVSGLKTQRIRRLQGDETAEFSWLISGKGNAVITAGAPNTGIIKTTVELR